LDRALALASVTLKAIDVVAKASPDASAMALAVSERARMLLARASH
jgi:hypothetical protein